MAGVVSMERAASAVGRDVIGNAPEALLLPALPSISTWQEMHSLAELT